MRIDLTADGAQSAARALTALADRAENARPALDDVADLIFAANRRLWATQGYGRWPAAEWPDMRVMFESGRLQRALTMRGAEPAALDFDRDAVFVGIPAGRSGIAYGRYHHLGEGVPQRAVVAPARAVRRDAVERIARWLAEGR